MREFIEIAGGIPLRGSVQIGGAKNAALPLLISTLLTDQPVTLENVPSLADINLTIALLEHFGAKVSYEQGKVTTVTSKLVATDASYSLVKALRASFWVLAPLLARGGAARVALPGGDIIGARPVDIHLEALTTMGADIKLKNGVVLATAPNGLKPKEITFRFPSVGATHQLIMAAALTPGTSVLKNSAKEPEIVALADLINLMGGDVEGAGTSTVVIHGRESLGGASLRLIGDRIEAGTYLLAAAATRGRVRADGVSPDHLGRFLELADLMGVRIQTGPDYIEFDADAGISATDASTGPFPELATDLQAPLMAAMTVAKGSSHITETVYEGRFGHVSELCRMGAQITITDHLVTVTGVEKLAGAPVDGMDIRAAAALVIAGLAADGVTKIHEPQHIRRGYEFLDVKLSKLGARISFKVSDAEDFMFAGC